MNLDDERHAVLELAKGKFTTDPDNHTGEGIFFSSRIFDEFAVLSGDVYYAHDYDDPTESIAQTRKPGKGTIVSERLPACSMRMQTRTITHLRKLLYL